MRLLLTLMLSGLAYAQFVPVPFTHTGGGGGSIALVQDRGDSGHGACNNNGTPSTSLTCAFSSAPTAGNTVVAFCATYNTNCTISDNGGTDTYTQVALTLQGGSSGSINNNCLESPNTHKVICVWYSLNVMGSSTLKYAVAASSYIIGHQYEFSGVLTSGAFDQEISNNNNDASASSGTTTTGSTGQSNELVINGCVVENSVSSFSAGGSYTLGMSDPSVAATVVGMGEQYITSESSGAQTTTLTFGVAAGSGYSCATATFKHS